MTVRVAVVDDVGAVRASLKALLQSYGYEVSTYVSAGSFLESLDYDRPDCVLLDIRMREMDGLTAQRLLADKAPQVPAIIITGHGDVGLAVRAMKNGAHDFIEKPIDDQLLVGSVATAVEKRVQARAAEASHLVLKLKYGRLTKREHDVLDLVIEGYSSLAVASLLSISVRTVDHHRASIHSKMEAASLSHLIRMALQLKSNA